MCFFFSKQKVSVSQYVFAVLQEKSDNIVFPKEFTPM